MFVSVDGVLKAVVKQKTPVGRVVSETGSFYVDYEGYRMPLSENYSARVPLVSGKIDAVENEKLSEVLKMIYEDDFLKKNDNFGANIDISDEKNELLETGGGLVFARKLLDNGEDFLILNADILTDLNITEFVKFHKKKRDLATLAVSNRNSSRKLLFNEEMVLRGWLNVQTGEQRLAEFNKGFKALAFSGIHVINPKLFDKIKRKGKFSIMEEYLDLMHTEKIQGFEHNAKLIDVGRPESVLEAEKYFK